MKGVAIFLVVLGHCPQSLYPEKGGFIGKPLFLYIYSFHMSLFMIISGYFSGTSINVIAYLIPQTVDMSTKLNSMFLKLSDYTYEFYLTHFIVLLALRPIMHSIIQMLTVSFGLSICISLMVKSFTALLTAWTPISNGYIDENRVN